MNKFIEPEPQVHHVLIGHGEHPIPPTNWGAVESIIWQFSQRLSNRGIPVTIVNKRRYRAVLDVLMLSFLGKADVVYCHSEKPIPLLSKIAKWRKFLLISTTHSPLSVKKLSEPEEKALRRCKDAPFHLVLRDDVKDLILARNPNAFCSLQLNATETAEFKTKPIGNGKAICVGRIQARKRQNETALLLAGSGIDCDFVGPIMGEMVISDELKKRHLGTWDRATLYDQLCEYSCLILLSESEGQPLVVVEALAAGIPVVVSKDAAWNLDLTKPYIFVVDSDDQVVDAVRQAISNRDQSTTEIRTYAVETFDYELLLDNYLAQVSEWLLHEKVHC